MTYTEKKELPLGVGDDVKHYDDGKDGHPKKLATGKVIEIGEFTFLVKWDDMEDETEYEWHKVTIEGSRIIEHYIPPVSSKKVEEAAKEKYPYEKEWDSINHSQRRRIIDHVRISKKGWALLRNRELSNAVVIALINDTKNKAASKDGLKVTMNGKSITVRYASFKK